MKSTSNTTLNTSPFSTEKIWKTVHIGYIDFSRNRSILELVKFFTDMQKVADEKGYIDEYVEFNYDENFDAEDETMHIDSGLYVCGRRLETDEEYILRLEKLKHSALCKKIEVERLTEYINSDKYKNHLKDIEEKLNNLNPTKQ